MKKLIRLHKVLIEDFALRFGLSAYQVTWIAFGKGLVIGFLAGVWL